MTLGNARGLGLENEIGGIAPGARPIWSCSTRAPHRPWRTAWKRSRNLEEELFVLMTLGDDRAVRQCYIAGEPAL